MSENKAVGFSIDNSIDIDAIRIELVTKEVIELKNMLVELDIYVSFLSDGLMATLLLRDNINLVNNGPILGGEKVFVRFKSPMYNETGWTELNLKVQSITERVPANNQGTLVKLALLSETYMDSMSIRMSRGYNGQYSGAAQLYWKSAGFQKELQADQSQGLYTFTLPSTKQFMKNMNFLADRSRTSDNMPFVFFEDLDYFNMLSWSKLLSQEPKVELVHQPQLTEETPEKAFRNILSLEYGKNQRDMSVFSGLGLNGRAEQVYDPLTKTLKIENNSYDKYSKQVPLLNENKMETMLGSGQSTRFVLKKFDDSQASVFNRDALNYSLNANYINVVTYGDNRMRVGTVVTMNLPSPQLQNGSDLITEKFVGGRFIVVGLKHAIRPNEYRLYWSLSNESFLTGVTNNG